MENKASITSLMSAFTRAYHSAEGRAPVFDDSVARRLMTDGEYNQVGGYIKGGAEFFAPGRSFGSEAELLEWCVNTQLAPTPLARACFNEDSLRSAALTGTTQYVILGAGLDSFAWRQPELMKKLTVFEVDHPLTQSDKRRRLARAGLDIPDGLRFVPADLSRDDLRSALAAQGFDESQKTFFSCLGLSYYLRREDMEQLLGAVSSFAAEGSSLLFDCGDEGLFSASERRVKNMLAMAEAGGEPMRFCAGEDELTRMLERHGFLIYELLDPPQIQQRYFAGRADGLSAFEHVCFVLSALKSPRRVDTKERILRAALRLFAQNGYEAVSVQDIAGSLSMTKGALYRHYKNKRDIFDCIIERMSSSDRDRAGEYNVPADPPGQSGGEYAEATPQLLKTFTEAQFRYWTEDALPSCFRRMLTLEQYRSDEMSGLFQQFFGSGPLEYTRQLLCGMGASDPEGEALRFYGPVFLLYSVYDGAADKTRVLAGLSAHLEGFSPRMKGDGKNER